MWFGDAVTIACRSLLELLTAGWDHLWLSEAFATLIGELVVPSRWVESKLAYSSVYPDWNFGTDIITAQLKSALALDSRRGSHPVEMHCPSVADVGQYYDDIAYCKGAAVLRMLAAVVGQDAFIAGVSTYLQEHLYGNTTPDDLWRGGFEANALIQPSPRTRRWMPLR